MSAIAIIPARGGSKRIPRKNIKDFLGKPIIAYSIQAAVESKVFDEVMVSTDDEEIAKIAQEYGAKVPFKRSPNNSTDFASTFHVIEEVVDAYKRLGRTFQKGCCIYATAPFVRADRLVKGLETLIESNFDSVFPIIQFSYPIWRALQISGDKIEMIWPENLSKRTQDLPKAFHDAGQWYWFDIEKVKFSRRLWTENSFGVVIDEVEAHDIDNQSDWRIAEMKYQALNNIQDRSV